MRPRAGTAITGAVETLDPPARDLPTPADRTPKKAARGKRSPAGAPGRHVVVWQRMGEYSHAAEVARDAADRVFGAIALVLASPLLLAVAIAVKLDSPGPVICRHTRIGRGGRPFVFWRFRTTCADAKRRPAELDECRFPDVWAVGPGIHPRIEIDPRLTRPGRFMRRTGLDGLPNLINVVTGHMSLVGPRPEIPELLPYCGGAAKLVVSVKPGITSLAGLLGGEQLTFQEMLDLDLRYVRERSPALDAGVLLGTMWLVLTGRNVAG
jgi:lipopolysaccharide/colanic/teichoic acid biosynthesis glycosyltransferase